MGVESVEQQEFSIGEAASLVGVSTHVIRSWERRLQLRAGTRTPTNQRRYRMQDIRRLMTIKGLHDQRGLRLSEAVEAASRAERPDVDADGAAGPEPADASEFWAPLLDALPELLLVVDEGGRVVTANRTARHALRVRKGSQLARLAPPDSRSILRSLFRNPEAAGRARLELRRGGRRLVVGADAARLSLKSPLVVLTCLPQPGVDEEASPAP